MTRRRSLNGVRVLEFFDNKVAFRGNAVATQSGASHFTDALCDARLPIHQDVEIVGIKHQQARSGDGGHGRGSARATQRCDLAEEMTGTQPNTFVLELDLHFPGGDEVHGMRGLTAPGDDIAGLGLLCVQQPHDVGNIRCLQFGEQRYACDHSPR